MRHTRRTGQAAQNQLLHAHTMPQETATAALHTGTLVQGRGLPGIGRVLDRTEHEVLVEFFESAVTPVAQRLRLPVVDCQRTRLEKQTRVYWLNEDTAAWYTGRVVGSDDEASTYFVRLPNSEVDLLIPESQLRVRWDKPVQEPLHVLVGGANESPYYSDTRLPMIHDLLRQRAACMSVPALLSSAVDVYPHQVHTALTVLSDPVQRYLLADEVGLGKTVEAGLIIRQTLLDGPDTKVLIMAPEALRRQWQEELLEKFFIDDFSHNRVAVTSHEHPEKWQRYHGFHLVIVDEAHKLVNGYGPEDTPYQELAALSRAVPGLLLLSATPFSARPRTQLGLLHLLDPALYRWEDLDAFDLRASKRKDLANAVFNLSAAYEQELPYAIDDIAQVLPEDQHFRDLAARVLELLDDDGDLIDEKQRRELTSRVAGLRGHISETYRLHRRLIQHRRHEVTRDDEDSGHLPFAVTGRRRAEVVEVDSAGERCVSEALGDWQRFVQRILVDTDNEQRAAAYGYVLSVLLSRADATGQDLIDTLTWRLRGDETAAARAGLTKVERSMLRSAPVLAEEHQALMALTEVSSADELVVLANLAASITSAYTRSVIFCGAGSLAGQLAERLAQLSPLPVARHTADVDSDKRHTAVVTWKASGGVLVADQSAEEGLNLQGADAVLHCRLPWSPNHLEQRLGRIDRFGPQAWQRQASAASYVLGSTDHEHTLAGAWLSLLTNGFGIFDVSVSGLQETIAENMPAIWSDALMNGPTGLLDQTNAVIEVLRVGRDELDRIDMLESVHDPAKTAKEVVARIGELDMRWRVSEEATRQLATGRYGGLGFTYDGADGNASFGLGRELLVPPRLLTLQERKLDNGQLAGTFDRSRATTVPGTRLLRAGSPFIDALASVLSIDDRGQASAFWRRARGYNGEPLVVFGFDYLAEADIRDAYEVTSGCPETRRAIRRQADSLLSPVALRIWIHAGSNIAVSNERLLGLLGRKFDNARDKNLNPTRIGALHKAVGGVDRVGPVAGAAHAAATAELMRRAELVDRCEEAYTSGLEQASLLRAQANARAAAAGLVGDGDSTLRSVELLDRLVQRLRTPRIRTLSATCVLLSDSWEQVHEH